MQDLYIGDVGKGFPLVLVHGFLGSSEMWKPQINFFKNNFRVITPDLPGFGKSNKIERLQHQGRFPTPLRNSTKSASSINF